MTQVQLSVDVRECSLNRPLIHPLLWSIYYPALPKSVYFKVSYPLIFSNLKRSAISTLITLYTCLHGFFQKRDAVGIYEASTATNCAGIDGSVLGALHHAWQRTGYHHVHAGRRRRLTDYGLHDLLLWRHVSPRHGSGITDHSFRADQWAGVCLRNHSDEQFWNQSSVGTQRTGHARGPSPWLLTGFDASFWASGICVKPAPSQARLVRVFCWLGIIPIAQRPERPQPTAVTLQL